MQVAPRIVRVQPSGTRRPPGGQRLARVRRLAVARTDRLGDLIVSVPAIAALRRTYHDAHLTLVVRDRWAPLARCVPGVDAVVGVERLGELSADAIVCLSREGSTAWAARRAGIPQRIGTGRRAWSWLFTRRSAASRRTAGVHEADHALELACLAGATLPDALPDAATLHLDEASLDTARSWLASHEMNDGFVLVHPGSGGSCPRWPATHFSEIVRSLTAAGRRVVVSIGPDDAEVAAALDRLPPGAMRFDSAGPLELAGVAAHATAAIGNSTGPMHLAAALGTPTLTIHPPWASCAPERWGPYAANGAAVVAWSDEAVGWSRARRRRDAERLMRALVPDQLLAAAFETVLG